MAALLTSASTRVGAIPLENSTNSINAPNGTYFPSVVSYDIPQRSIWELVWSCAVTIFTCTWVALHPNIPTDNELRWKTTLIQVRLMVCGIIAPEPIVYTAMREWRTARKIARQWEGMVCDIISIEILIFGTCSSRMDDYSWLLRSNGWSGCLRGWQMQSS